MAVVGLLQAADPDGRDLGARRLVARYGDSLFGYLVNTVGVDELDAADVLNDALYRAITRIEQIKDPENLAGWLYRLVYRAGIDWHRRSRKRREVPLEREQLFVYQEETGTEGTDPELLVRRDRVDAVMQTLSPRDREILSAIAHDLSNEELAEVLDVTAAHARVLRHRASERFRKAYAKLISQNGLKNDGGGQS